MDLVGLTFGAIGLVNPQTMMKVQVSTGATTAADGSQTPTYAPAIFPMGEVQPLSDKDLLQLDALNIQGSQRAIYLQGHINGIVRPNSVGGDLVTDPDGQVWLVTMVLEYWPDWTKVAVTLQLDGTTA